MRTLVRSTVAFVLASLATVAASQSADPVEAARRLSASLAAIQLLDKPTYAATNELLRQGRFDEFERLSRRYEDAFRKDPLAESPLEKLYGAIGAGPADDEALLRMLDRWVKERPSSESHTARGFYYERQGYRRRGDKFVRETPAANFEGMRESHRSARADFDRALRLNGSFMPAYEGTLLVLRASGTLDEAKRIVDKAVSVVPQSYYLRYTYALSLRPRWGGSYARMREYAESQDAFVPLNPRIWGLRAEAHADQAMDAVSRRDLTAAIAQLTTALQYGDRLEFLEKRAKLYEHQGELELALKDFRRYQSYSADNPQVNAAVEQLKTLYPSKDVARQ